MRGVWSATVVLSAVFVAACDPTCQSACSKFWGEDQCNARLPSTTSRNEALQGCISTCTEGVQTPGVIPPQKLRLYDPEIQFSSTISAGQAITNNAEAAAWMDCVAGLGSVPECREKTDPWFCIPAY